MLFGLQIDIVTDHPNKKLIKNCTPPMFSSICFAFLIEVEFMPAEAAQRHSMDQTVLMP